MTTTERKPRHKFPKSENPRDQFLRVRATKADIDYIDRIIKRLSMGRAGEDSRSDFVRHLITKCGDELGVPYDPTRPALTADEMFAKLGVKNSGPAAYVLHEASSLEGSIDPDRYDESNTSTIEPLPERKK